MSLYPQLLLVFALALNFVLVPKSHAHEPVPVVALVTLNPQELAVTLNVHLESVLPTLITRGPESASSSDRSVNPESDSAPPADRSFDTLYPDELRTEFTRVQSRFLQAVTPVADGSAGRKILAPVFKELHISPTAGEDDLRRSTLRLTIAIPADAETLQWYWPKPMGELHLQVKSDAGRELLTTVVAEGESSPALKLHQSASMGAGHTFVNYVRAGFRHILPLGLDHLLFIVGLVILSVRWQDLVAQISVFTVAHTLTLALGSTGVVSISPGIVEPLIALSIVYIAVENVVRSQVSGKRLLVIFLFGLLHGLGFALVLGTLGMSTVTFFIALLGFNIGVELGQLSVAAACLLFIALVFGRRPDSGAERSAHEARYRRWLVVPVSALIGAVGLYWLVTRLLG
ncbi:MAG: HupE/UreJ family protein [Gammaproteobacteria bacterium]|nr:HupE/UreJ family protein [Gammaproteobacteria bacterium]